MEKLKTGIIGTGKVAHLHAAALTELEESDFTAVCNPGEEHLLEEWQRQDAEFFHKVDATRYYHQLQLKDFLRAIDEGRAPLITGAEGRKTVELFTAIYRSQRDRQVIVFPLDAGADGRDGQ